MASQAVAERRDNPVAVIRQNLTQMAPEFSAALPAHVSVEKFTRVTMTAIQNNPDLQNADRRSLFGAVVRLAQDGLLPDGREAAIVLFGNKAQAMPMIAGVLKKVRQSGEVAYVSAQVVYEKDHFVWKLGFEEDVEHQPPSLEQPRGKPIGAYATAVLKDGSRLLEVMSLEEIEKVRSVSRAKNNGPWVQWWGEMARKTVMRRLSKRLPMSSDLEDSLDRDETLKPANDAPALQVVEPEPPVSRLDALEHRLEYADEGEGPADEQRGETMTADEEVDASIETTEGEDEKPAWFAKVETIRNLVASAKNKQALKDADFEFTRVRAGLPDDVVAELDGLIDAKRKALTKTAEPAADDYAATVTNILAQIETAIGEASWEAAKAEYLKHVSKLPKPECDRIEAALQAKKGELGL